MTAVRWGDSVPWEARRNGLVAVVVVAVVNVMDCVSTWLVLSVGGGEGNPVGAALLGWRVVLAKAVLTAVLAYRMWRVPSLTLLCGAWFVAGIYTAACALNLLAYLTLNGG